MSQRNLVLDKIPLTNSTMKDHFDIHWKKVTSFDKVRLNNVLFTIQYSVLYVIVGAFIGSLMEYYLI